MTQSTCAFLLGMPTNYPFPVTKGSQTTVGAIWLEPVPLRLRTIEFSNKDLQQASTVLHVQVGFTRIDPLPLSTFDLGMFCNYQERIEVKIESREDFPTLGRIAIIGEIEDLPMTRDLVVLALKRRFPVGARVKMRTEDGQGWLYGHVAEFYHRKFAVWQGHPTATELPNPMVYGEYEDV